MLLSPWTRHMLLGRGAGPGMENESTDKIAQLSSNLYSFRRPTNEHFYNGWKFKMLWRDILMLEVYLGKSVLKLQTNSPLLTLQC